MKDSIAVLMFGLFVGAWFLSGYLSKRSRPKKQKAPEIESFCEFEAIEPVEYEPRPYRYIYIERPQPIPEPAPEVRREGLPPPRHWPGSRRRSTSSDRTT